MTWYSFALFLHIVGALGLLGALAPWIGGRPSLATREYRAEH